eukprot:CAMPEP_0204371130 /NCGR_PEP_ID=MMETSP0469-20131031/46252_1 /ASSEMBLY_ACC=CAM_ASM_000384 /TAXON_ID=2969 /ORGANISM="Oxyrrhis marina" /LENGTH=616 /DNA_ID=CAMNT_0051361177 /DNA_START=1 /DNA_END=1852 /DNA_ORIENTATION=+
MSSAEQQPAADGGDADAKLTDGGVDTTGEGDKAPPEADSPDDEGSSASREATDQATDLAPQSSPSESEEAEADDNFPVIAPPGVDDMQEITSRRRATLEAAKIDAIRKEDFKQAHLVQKQISSLDGPPAKSKEKRKTISFGVQPEAPVIQHSPPVSRQRASVRKSFLLQQMGDVSEQAKQARKSKPRHSVPAAGVPVPRDLQMSKSRYRTLTTPATELSPDVLAYEAIKKNQKRRQNTEEPLCVDLPVDHLLQAPDGRLRQSISSVIDAVGSLLGADERLLWRFFLRHDNDMDGTIDTEEMESFFQELDPEADQEALETYFKQADRDHSGQLDFVEVLDWFFFTKRTVKLRDSLLVNMAAQSRLDTLHSLALGLFRDDPSSRVLRACPRDKLLSAIVQYGEALAGVAEWVAEQHTLVTAENSDNDLEIFFTEMYTAMLGAMPAGLHQLANAFTGQDLDFHGVLRPEAILRAYRDAVDDVQDMREISEGESRLRTWLDTIGKRRVSLVELLQWWEDNYDVEHGLVMTAIHTAAAKITKPRVLTRLEVQPSKIIQAAVPQYLKMYFEVADILRGGSGGWRRSRVTRWGPGGAALRDLARLPGRSEELRCSSDSLVRDL